jgi:dTMP kinase
MKVENGFFITLEGGEGSGKSTQIKRLSAHLTAQGYDVVTTREPGGTPEAEKIRSLLVDRDGGAWTPMAEILLFFAARAMHVEKLIKPALAAGKVVLCDRFTDSTRAYQSYGHGFDASVIESLNQTVLGGFAPDLILILDIPVEAGLLRSENRLAKTQSHEDRFERLDVAFHKRLREGYLDIAHKNPQRCVVVDAEGAIEVISERLCGIVGDKLTT